MLHEKGASKNTIFQGDAKGLMMDIILWLETFDFNCGLAAMSESSTRRVKYLQGRLLEITWFIQHASEAEKGLALLFYLAWSDDGNGSAVKTICSKLDW